jgi:hypothetical protein
MIQAALSADAHARHALIPAFDHLVRADGEREAGRRVELPAFAVGLT